MKVTVYLVAQFVIAALLMYGVRVAWSQERDVIHVQQDDAGAGQLVAPPIPAYDADDRLIVQQLVTIGQLANADCQALDSMRVYLAMLAQVTARLEEKYEGFSFDRSTGGLRAKP